MWTAVLALMVWAGFWQLGRAEEKQIINQNMAAGITLTPKSMADWHNIDDYLTIKMEGHYAPMHFFLANQFHQGQVGFNVFTPFKTNQGLWLLVNRGWTASADIKVEVDDRSRFVTGFMAAWPRPGVQLGEQEFVDQSRQEVTYLPLAKTKKLLNQKLCETDGCPIFDRVIKLSPQADNGFVRDWQAPMMTVARHHGYAFQWFGMSLVLSILYIIFLRKHYATKT